MQTSWFVYGIAALLVLFAFLSRRDDQPMPTQTRIVLIVSGLVVAILAIWLSMRPGR